MCSLNILLFKSIPQQQMPFKWVSTNMHIQSHAVTTAAVAMSLLSNSSYFTVQHSTRLKILIVLPCVFHDAG